MAWRTHRATPTIDGADPGGIGGIDGAGPADWREHPAALLGLKDAVDVLAGERVVRAILAFHAVPTFRQIWPDLDWELYRRGYAEAPGSKPPMDRRQQASGPGYDGPHRRADDLT